MKIYIRNILILLLFSCTVAIAQPGDPGGDPDNPIPITGIEILIAAGGLLGAKKIYDSRKNNNK